MKISITDDFNLRKIVLSGQCFRPKELCDGHFLFMCRDKVLFIKDLGNNNFDFSCSKSDFENTWRSYFDLDTNYKKIRENIPPSDAFLKEAAALGAGIRILCQDPFETLISFIISQRKSIPAIRSSIEKIAGFYGKKVHTEYGDFCLFPTPDEILKDGGEKLSECSLGYRLPYVTEAVRRIASGELDLNSLTSLSDEDLLFALMELKGVGIKVAGCVGLFAYKRGEIAPVDTWIARVINNEYGGISPFPSYGKLSGIYQQYFFFKSIS